MTLLVKAKNLCGKCRSILPYKPIEFSIGEFDRRFTKKLCIPCLICAMIKEILKLKEYYSVICDYEFDNKGAWYQCYRCFKKSYKNTPNMFAVGASIDDEVEDGFQEDHHWVDDNIDIITNMIKVHKQLKIEVPRKMREKEQALKEKEAATLIQRFWLKQAYKPPNGCMVLMRWNEYNNS